MNFLKNMIEPSGVNVDPDINNPNIIPDNYNDLSPIKRGAESDVFNFLGSMPMDKKMAALNNTISQTSSKKSSAKKGAAKKGASKKAASKKGAKKGGRKSTSRSRGAAKKGSRKRS